MLEMSENKQQRIVNFFKKNPQAIVQEIPHHLLPSSIERDIKVDILREDLMFPLLSGNKYRKLKYLLTEHPFQHAITFGGPFSNHIYACSLAAHIFGFKLTAVVRAGRQVNSDTLSTAIKWGTNVVMVNPTNYRLRYSEQMQKEWLKEFNADFVIPEGGAGGAGMKGCMELLASEGLSMSNYDYVIAMAGTGTMITGMAQYIVQNKLKTELWGISALKRHEHLSTLLHEKVPRIMSQNQVKLFSDHHFGGIGKWNDELIELIKAFDEVNIPLDHIYTAKLLWYVRKWIQEARFESAKRILLIHSGGLQGRSGLSVDISR